MLRWLRRLRKCVTPPEPECLRFLKALDAEHEPAVTYKRSGLPYLYDADLVYPDVQIRLQYNSVRESWSLDIWHRNNCRTLYQYDIDPPPPAVLHYLRETHDISPNIARLVHHDEDACRREHRVADDLKQQYLRKYQARTTEP